MASIGSIPTASTNKESIMAIVFEIIGLCLLLMLIAFGIRQMIKGASEISVLRRKLQEYEDEAGNKKEHTTCDTGKCKRKK